ncbi:MAG TPA: PSD1 and planctomycete cytochrome C domain-containing protein [Pirellulales bacterium]
MAIAAYFVFSSIVCFTRVTAAAEDDVNAKTTATVEKQLDTKHPATAVDFYRDIKPIFVKHCFACHGPAKSESNLRLDLRSAAQRGGDNGPDIVNGDSTSSLLIQYATGKNEVDIMMPPKGKGVPLSEQEIALLKLWIDQGACWPDLPSGATASSDAASGTKGEKDKATSDNAVLSEHWAFQPVRHVKTPISRDPWIDTPIDAFVLQQLQTHHLTPNPQASRIDLIRRVTFDLIGLPPTPEDVQQFINDKSADAYEHLVDRLLASPGYGEHWGRHWLDLARYADSDGFENDSDRPNAYKYRDYVIRSFNEDKSYNQFIVEQLAGDELANAEPEQLIGLGFCRNGPTIGNQINEKNRVDEVDDVVSTTSSVFLGLTVGCARCHDHKYEPISQHDYYRMFAVFNDAKKDNDGDIMHLSDTTDKPRESYVMLGGDYNRHGDEVEPGVPAVIDNGRADFSPSDAERPSAGRRLALARWIVDPKNPLTARVIVNRIWMYHFGRGLVNTPSNFGQSGDPPTHLELLDYLADQLVRGHWRIKPLTKMIVMSAVYRQSSAYDPEKSGNDGDNQWYWRYPVRRLEAEAIRDSILAASGNLNLQMYGPGIKPKIPDSILTTTSKEMWPKVAKEGPEQWRRSVYIFVKRSLPVPMLEGFDAPTATQTCERRMTTVVATQALQLLNDDFSNRQAEYMATRVIHDAGEDISHEVERAYWLTFSRPPNDSQRRQAAEFVNNQMESARQALLNEHKREGVTPSQIKIRALADLCHVLFNADEFVYLN